MWFQIVVETFLRSVGADWARTDIDSGLAVHESLYRRDGWYSDGAERSYDHYVGWALHFYPLVWADMAGADLCSPDLRATFAARLRRYLDDAIQLVGADGSPLLQGRSLIYRFAAAAPFWVGASTGETTLRPGQLRRACSGMLRHFGEHGAPDERGLLTLGLHHEWPAMAQSYSGPGSPYWASKGMFGLALPAGHPVWTAVEEPLPVEESDQQRVVAAPGWLVSGTRADGIVRVINHGTDHASPDDLCSDSPLYARFGYSTATVPPLVGTTLESPYDNSVALLDDAGVASHRSGFRTLQCRIEDGVPVAVSRGRAHWVDIAADRGPDHGSGRGGPVQLGPFLTVGSALRGALEVRMVRVDRSSPLDTLGRLEMSGWPVAAATPAQSRVDVRGCAATVSGSVTSTLVGRSGFDDVAVRRATGLSPLGDQVAIPVVRTVSAALAGRVYVAIVALCGGSDAEAVTGLRAEVSDQRHGDVVTVRWPDGKSTRVTLPQVKGSI